MSIWHQARREEKRIRGIISERRKRIEGKKTRESQSSGQQLRVNGNSMKIYCDPGITLEAESASTLIVWSGDGETIIDRFDGRTLLECELGRPSSPTTPRRISEEERMCHYEAYKVLVQNEASGVSESFFLSRLSSEDSAYKPRAEKKRTRSEVYYDYGGTCQFEDTTAKSVDDFVDVTQDNIGLLNSCGKRYGITGEDFYNLLVRDRCESREATPAVVSPRPANWQERGVRARGNPARDKINSLLMLCSRREGVDRKVKKPAVESSDMTFIDGFGGDGPPDDSLGSLFDQSVRVDDEDVHRLPEEKVVRRYRRSPSSSSDNEIWRGTRQSEGSPMGSAFIKSGDQLRAEHNQQGCVGVAM